MEDLIVRRPRPDDLDALVELCAEHAAVERADYDPTGKAERLRRVLFDEPDPNVTVLVMEGPGGRLLAYTSFTREFSTWHAEYFIYGDCMYLRPEARDIGIAMVIMRETAKAILEAGMNGIPAEWQTPTFNVPAIRLYESIGAVRKDKARYFLSPESMAKLASW